MTKPNLKDFCLYACASPSLKLAALEVRAALVVAVATAIEMKIVINFSTPRKKKALSLL